MTTFEEELRRALMYGCPFCQDVDGEVWDEFELKSIGYYYVDLTFNYCLSVRSRLRYTEREAKSEELALYCSSCREELWTADSGWIDQLKGVVEGD